MNTSDSTDLTHFDVRPLPCSAKHALIFKRWAELPVGGHFVLVNDHDPVPLYYQFSGLFGEAFSWEYLEAPADEFHVKITRLAETESLPPRIPLPKSCGHHHAPDQPAKPELDTRGLEAPEPMLRILEAVEKLPKGGRLRALTERRPVHLIEELADRGIRHSSEVQPDGTWSTVLERP